MKLTPLHTSVAIQRGNAASMLGTTKVDSEDEEFF